MHVVWINKSAWRKPGPIVYMGLLNALAFAANGWPTDYFVGAGEPSDTDDDLRDFYGVEPHPLLAVRRVAEAGGARRAVYDAALARIIELAERGKRVWVFTRELGCLGDLVRLKRRHPNLKVVHESHDYYLSIRHLPRRGWSTWRRMWAERLLLPRLDGLVLLTEHQRALYQQWMPALPMTAQPLGCLELPPADLEARRAQRRLAYIGHLHDYKGLELIFALAARLQGHGVEIACYGGGPAQVERLRARALDAGLSQGLRFHPFMSPRALHHTLGTEASLGLVPLQDTYYSRYLTCPVKALDSLAHGLPVLGSDLPSVREVARDAARYCPSGSAQSFADAALALLDDAAAYAAASRAAHGRAAELAWRLRAQRILAALDPASSPLPAAAPVLPAEGLPV